LAVKLTGSIGFTRDGRRFTMKISVDSTLSGLGSPAMIMAPADAEVVATPERLREVDARDYLLQGIAPPLRRNPDGTAVTPMPIAKPGGDKLPDGVLDRSPDRSPAQVPAQAPDRAITKPGKPPGKATNRKPRSDDPPKRRARPADGATP
jgi:hypothetical protein